MPTSRPVHLHLGLHKTGSTFFQRLLAQNSTGLAQHLHVLNRIGARENGSLALRNHVLKHHLHGLDPRDLRHLLAACGPGAADDDPARPLLITDEGLAGHHPGQTNRVRGIYTTLPQIIGAFAQALAPHPVTVHLMTRDPARWFESLYNQSVKQCRHTGSFAEFLPKVRPNFQWGPFLRKVRRANPGVTIRAHQLEGQKPFAGASILRGCGVPREVIRRLEVPPRANESLPPPLLDAMRVLNASGLSRDDLAETRAAFELAMQSRAE